MYTVRSYSELKFWVCQTFEIRYDSDTERCRFGIGSKLNLKDKNLISYTFTFRLRPYLIRIVGCTEVGNRL